MKRFFSCSSSQVAVERWNRRDQKLLEAVQRGDVGRVAALASRKSARPTKLNLNGQSPFHLAASKGLTECLTILLANGADINSKNEDGSTALHLATISCQPQCVKVLLQVRATSQYCSYEGKKGAQNLLTWSCSHMQSLVKWTALIPSKRSGQGLVQHPDPASQASPCELQEGSPPKSPGRAEPREEQDEEEEEDPCSDEWKWRYEEEQRKVSQLEQELVRKTEEAKAQAAAYLGLENQIREQARELGLLLSQEPGAPGGQGSRARPGGDGMEQGCPLGLLAERIQDLRKQQWAARLVSASKKAGDSASGATQRESHGRFQPEDQEAPQSPRWETAVRATGQQLSSNGGQAPGPEHTDKPPAGLKERPQAPGADPTGTVAEPGAAMTWLLLQLSEELAAVWREKDAAWGALSRPVLEGALGTPRAEAAAAAWEKMEARLEQVLVRLDRAKAGLQAPAQEPRQRAPKAGPATIPKENEGREKRAPGARGEPLGVPGGERMPGGGLAKGQLEREVAALRRSNGDLLEELGELGQERQRLQGELQSLSQRLQRDFVPKPEAQVQLQQLRRSVGLLTDELAMEKQATEKLRKRLASQSSGLQGLWDSLPPDLVGKAGAGRAAAERLEELQAGIGALVERHREAGKALARLEEENQQLRGPPAPRGQPGTLSEAPAPLQVAALEQDLGKLEEELRAVQATMSGKSQEIAKLKQLLYQATEEVAELRAREAAGLRQHEKTRASLVAQAQAWGQELKALLEKYNAACREMGELREAVAEERRRSEDLAARAAEQERQAAEMRARSQQFEKTAEQFKDKVDHLIAACRDKEAKIKELLKKLEQLSAEVLAVRGENARLALQLQDSQKNHEEIISTYRNHLLNAAQGYMEQDVYNILLRILSIQAE
ncbi:ankyrin repeat domain-containing protein 35 [Leptonychotes weddellii]|uniref:Ankyrin repeat domain-containing protein 35 n=1 Tax=Leptonychotes weddellii TaxID=9713 RepID=A0A2U3XFV8_LEPWE|nr:ankyrin repeat domain-containing protein 35 [Leptonychotes weddellii]